MKIKNYLLVGLVALGVIAASCSKDDSVVPEEGAAARLTINLTGGSPASKAAGVVTQTEENTLKDYGVYVFNSANILQKFAYFTGDQTGDQTINGLTTGAKTVVVLTNFGEVSAYPQTNEGSSSYHALKSTGIDFLKVPQTKDEVLAKGLPMSGEASVNLQEGEGNGDSNKATVQVYRLVAKVKLTGLTVLDPVNPGVGVNLETLGIMRAVKEISVLDASNVDPGNYYKGLSDTHGGEGVFQDRLHAAIANNYNESDKDTYFYVFPNFGETVNSGNATLMTFVSNQTANPSATIGLRYFPIVINPEAQGGITGTTGTFIERNTQYALSITFQHHDTGNGTPEEVVKPAEVAVNVKINDWSAEINQNVIWQ